MSEDVSAQSEGSSTQPQRECDENTSNSKTSGSHKLRLKKLKQSDETEALEERLNGILCCAVCLDLPKSSVYQCRNGHLVCSDCFNHLLADAQLRMGTAICPSCRTLISKDLCVRNLVVEKAVSELPVTCQACSATFPRFLREIHEKEVCHERKSQCSYSRIGCPWVGPYKKKIDHEKRCAQPKKKGSEIKKTLTELPYKEKADELFHLCDILASDEIAYNDLQLLGPYHTDEYYIRYETFRFCAFGMEWEVRAHVNNNEGDPTLSSERTLKYQLLLKETIDRSIFLRYTVVRGPFSEIKVRPRVEEFTFSSATPESHFAPIDLENSVECYRLLSGTIKFRLIMFMSDTLSNAK